MLFKKNTFNSIIACKVHASDNNEVIELSIKRIKKILNKIYDMGESFSNICRLVVSRVPKKNWEHQNMNQIEQLALLLPQYSFTL